MRELKFRAYHTQLKKFIYWVVNDKSTWFWDQVRECNLKVEQFTGLKDKNGKEIYFDDVYYCQTFKRKSLVNERMFGLWIADMNDMNNPLSEIEIIGNIYENPELLK